MADKRSIESHLEDAWKLLEAGNAPEARPHLETALALDPEEPAVFTLLAQLELLEGAPDKAEKAYRRALELDDQYFEALYGLAQQLAAAGELDESLELAEEAVSSAEEEDEFIDAILLKAEIELGGAEEDDARATLEELPPEAEFPAVDQHLRAGHSWLELQETGRARLHFEAALKREGDNAEALHGLGLIAEAEGDDKGRDHAWRKVRQLDLAAAPPPWSISVDALEEHVQGVLGELPTKMRELLGNVPIVIDEYPSETLVADGVDPRTLGLFAGTPFPEQSSAGAPHLEQIFLFRKNIERMAQSSEEVAAEVRTTLLHETGHFFGLDDEDLAEMDLG